MAPNVYSMNRILPVKIRNSPMRSDSLDKSEAVSVHNHAMKLKNYDETSQLGSCIEQKATLFLKSKSGHVVMNENVSASAQSPSKGCDSSQPKRHEKKKAGLLSRLGRCIFGKSKKTRVFQDGLTENQLPVDIPSTPTKMERVDSTMVRDTSSLATPSKSAVFSRVLHNPVTPIKTNDIKVARSEMERSPGEDAAQKSKETSSAANVNNEIKVCTRPTSAIQQSTSPSKNDNISDASQVLIDFLARKTQSKPQQEDVPDSPEKSLLFAIARLNGLKSKQGTKSFMTVEEKAKYLKTRREFFQSMVFRKIEYRSSKKERPQYMIATSLDKVNEYILSPLGIPTTPGKTISLIASEEKVEVNGHKSQIKTSKASKRLVPDMDDILARMERAQMVRTEKQTRTFFDGNVAKADDSCEVTSILQTTSMDSKRIKTVKEHLPIFGVPNSQFRTKTSHNNTVGFNCKSVINDKNHILSKLSFKRSVADSVRGEGSFLDF